MNPAAATDLPPAPTADGYLPSSHTVACAVHDPSPGRCDCGAGTRRPAYSLETLQVYARKAIGHAASAPAAHAQPIDDVQVMLLWREAGLPEHFLGNGGSNVRLRRFANLVRASTAWPAQSGEAACPSAD